MSQVRLGVNEWPDKLPKFWIQLCKPIWRWAETFQNDLAARADWCVKDFGGANHPPRAKVVGAMDRSVKPGRKVTLSTEGSTDPDGDRR